MNQRLTPFSPRRAVAWALLYRQLRRGGTMTVSARILHSWTLEDGRNMRVHINRALERMNSGSLLAKCRIYDLLGRDASRWHRIRPLVYAHGRTANRTNEPLGAMRNVDELRSQFGQDAFVLSQLSFKQEATSSISAPRMASLGATLTYSRKRYGWNGVLADPARCWHDLLQRNRSAHIELACVAGKSGESVALYEKVVFSRTATTGYSNRSARPTIGTCCVMVG